MISEIEVLVDWQNVFVAWRKMSCSRGNSQIDAEDAVAELSSHVRSAVAHFGRRIPTRARIYGSGIETNTDFGMFVRSALYKGKISDANIRLTLDPVDRPVHSEGDSLSVSLCPFDIERDCRRDGCNSKVREQKLADTMIATDAAYLGVYSTIGVVVISDDVDMIPGLLLAAHFRRSVGGDPAEEIAWYRPHSPASPYATRYCKHFLTRGSRS